MKIHVVTNSHTSVRRFFATEEEAEKYADEINDNILSPQSADVGELTVLEDKYMKPGLIKFLNDHAFIGVG